MYNNRPKSTGAAIDTKTLETGNPNPTQANKHHNMFKKNQF